MDNLDERKPSSRDWTLLMPEEAAEKLRISVRHLNDLCRSKELRFVRMSPHQKRFRQVDLDEFIERKLSPEMIDRSGHKDRKSVV